MVNGEGGSMVCYQLVGYEEMIILCTLCPANASFASLDLRIALEERRKRSKRSIA